ncbi:hypothetical protein CH063_08248, partial [Colletotrichum higginsianum]
KLREGTFACSFHHTGEPGDRSTNARPTTRNYRVGLVEKSGSSPTLRSLHSPRTSTLKQPGQARTRQTGRTNERASEWVEREERLPHPHPHISRALSPLYLSLPSLLQPARSTTRTRQDCFAVRQPVRSSSLPPFFPSLRCVVPSCPNPTGLLLPA